ncbi:MAG TPA: tetratricopeptide repeat protein [Clostridia bacterium]|nr:tetratricopeptide repeat protein [Clostridia bacterium]
MESNVVELPVADRIWAWFETNKKQIVTVAGIATVVGLVVYFFTWQREAKEAAASTALASVATGIMDGSNNRADAAQAYLTVASKYPGTQAGARAMLQAAGAFFAEGKYAEAQAQFERFTREYQGSPLMGQAAMGKATSLDAQGKTDQAVAAYKELVTRHPNANFIPQAKFSLARLYETQGQLEQARDLYLEVEQSARFTAFGNEAGMRVEELIAKNPKLAPTPPSASTNTVPAKVGQK